MVDVPAVPPPVTTPAVEMVATPVAELLHIPPATPSESVMVNVWQTGALPTIADGCGLTVTTAVLLQPPAMVYVIVAVPADTPVTSPVADTVAVPVLLHVPLPVASVSAVVDPAHTLKVPVMAAGVGFTVTSVTV